MVKWIRIGIPGAAPTPNDQSNNSISINATSSYIAPGENSCIITPIRDASNETITSLLGYKDSSGEVVQAGPFDRFTPAGTIIPFALPQGLTGGDVVEPTPGWLWCNGAIGLDDVKYKDLSGALGTTYGSQGQLPDLRGRTIFGDLAGAVDPSRSYLTDGGPGSVVGDDNISADQMPSHKHNFGNHLHPLGPHTHTTLHDHDMTHIHTVPLYDGSDAGGPGFGNADEDGGTYAIGGMNTTTSGSSVATTTTNNGSGPTNAVPQVLGNAGSGASFLPPAVIMNFLIKY